MTAARAKPPAGAKPPAERKRRAAPPPPTLRRAFDLAFPGGPNPEFRNDAERVTITGVTADSRRAQPGDLFVAIRGETHDGHAYLDQAQARGAAAALVERPPAKDTPFPWARVPDTRKAAGPVAHAVHGSPSERLRLVGVTGTNGKTTVTWLLDEVFRRRDRAGILGGTLGYRFAAGGRRSRLTKPRLTTWEAPDLAAFLAEAEAAGCVFGALECSSHGLALDRLTGARFEVAVFTNLTPDHGDFHPDFDHYYQAKRRLFTDLLRPEGTAVVNADDSKGRGLAGELRGWRPDVRVLTYGASEAAEIRITRAASDLDGTKLLLSTPEGSIGIASRLVGGFNAENLTAAWAALTALGIERKEAANLLGQAPAPPGRMERVLPRGLDDPEGPVALVDYAHTPDALARALEAAREIAAGRPLTVVFGCGGERDRVKRYLMGEAASRLADRVVLTSDNPRTENPADIIEDIRAGVSGHEFRTELAAPEGVAAAFGADFAAEMAAEDAAKDDGPHAVVIVEPDRREAIALAVRTAEPGEVVLVAGRGHETHQQIGEKLHAFSDRRVTGQALRDRAEGRW